MATQPDVLYVGPTVKSLYPRIFPEQVQPVKFSGVDYTTHGQALRVGTAVAWNTSTSRWEAWNNAGGTGVNVVAGFVYPDPITVKGAAGGEVIGLVLTAGRIHIDDCYSHIEDAYATANLKTACASGPRALGIFFDGLITAH